MLSCFGKPWPTGICGCENLIFNSFSVSGIMSEGRLVGTKPVDAVGSYCGFYFPSVDFPNESTLIRDHGMLGTARKRPFPLMTCETLQKQQP